MNEDTTPPRGGATITMIDIHNMVLETRAVVSRLETKLDQALRPISRPYAERVSTVASHVALIVIAVSLACIAWVGAR